MRSQYLGLLAATALSLATNGSARAQELLIGNLLAGAGPFATLAKTNEIAAQMAVASRCSWMADSDVDDEPPRRVQR